MARPLQRIADLAEGQWGLVTRQQAQNARVAWSSLSRLISDGRLERVAHGVYRVRGAEEADHMSLRAAWLQLDPGKLADERLRDSDVALASHASAAALYGVGDLRDDLHEFSLSGKRRSRRPDVRIHRRSVPDTRRIILRGLPVVRAGWLPGDLLSDDVEPGEVAQITMEILRNVHDYPRIVAEGLAPHAAQFGFPSGNGAALLDHLLELVGYRDREHMVEMARSG